MGYIQLDDGPWKDLRLTLIQKKAVKEALNSLKTFSNETDRLIKGLIKLKLLKEELELNNKMKVAKGGTEPCQTIKPTSSTQK